MTPFISFFFFLLFLSFLSIAIFLFLSFVIFSSISLSINFFSSHPCSPTFYSSFLFSLFLFFSLLSFFLRMRKITHLLFTQLSHTFFVISFPVNQSQRESDHTTIGSREREKKKVKEKERVKEERRKHVMQRSFNFRIRNNEWIRESITQLELHVIIRTKGVIFSFLFSSERERQKERERENCNSCSCHPLSPNFCPLSFLSPFLSVTFSFSLSLPSSLLFFLSCLVFWFSSVTSLSWYLIQIKLTREKVLVPSFSFSSSHSLFPYSILLYREKEKEGMREKEKERERSMSIASFDTGSSNQNARNKFILQLLFHPSLSRDRTALCINAFTEWPESIKSIKSIKEQTMLFTSLAPVNFSVVSNFWTSFYSFQFSSSVKQEKKKEKEREREEPDTEDNCTR